MRTLIRFLFLSAVNHQITIIVVESLIFKGFREWVARRSSYLGSLVSCHLCFGTWVGFFLALLFRPHFVEAPNLPNEPPAVDRAYRHVALFVGDSFAIALGGRVFNEVLGLLRREVAVKEEERELLEEEIELLEEEAG
ncbi:MAG TPA: hypothetical protein VFZ25_16925 [Chloroflexota bacterium]|nr:hypothetical protein [Chloroflexota bacterium]